MKKSPFRWTVSWDGIVLTDDNLLLPNTWTLVLEYDAVSDEMLHRDIGMQRLEFMIEEKFQSATWTNINNPWVEVFYKKLNTFVITLPTDPHDSMVGAAAMLKAQSITAGVFEIHRCSISSKLGYSVENIIDMEEANELADDFNHSLFSDGPWFMREDAGFTDIVCIEDDQKTLIKDTVGWEKFELNWDHYNEAPESSININKHERWIPLVIKGGANKDED